MNNKIVGRITNPKDLDGDSIETVLTVSDDDDDGDGEEIVITAGGDENFYLVMNKKQLLEALK